MRRGLLAIAALAATLIVVGCGGKSSADAEHVVEAGSHGALTEAACNRTGQDPANGELSYACTARYRHRLIKATAYFNEAGRSEAIAWPCAPAHLRWRKILRTPHLRCGTPVGRLRR